MEVCNSSSYSKYTYSGGAHQWIGSTQPDAECNKQPECNKQASGGFPYCFDIQF
jgi:hypothetical protein